MNLHITYLATLMTAVKIDHHKKAPIVLCGSIHYVIKI